MVEKDPTKIMSLHAKVENLKEFIKGIDIHLSGRIKKIEEVHEENFHMSKGELIAYRNIQKDILELEKKVDDKEKNWDVINAQWESFQEDLEEHEQMFSELKEQVKENIHGIDCNSFTELRNKEVLRELGKDHIAFRDDEGYEIPVDLYNLLSKLDGLAGSARQTAYECISCGRPMEKGELCPICLPEERPPDATGILVSRADLEEMLLRLEEFDPLFYKIQRWKKKYLGDEKE